MYDRFNELSDNNPDRDTDEYFNSAREKFPDATRFDDIYYFDMHTVKPGGINLGNINHIRGFNTICEYYSSNFELVEFTEVKELQLKTNASSFKNLRNLESLYINSNIDTSGGLTAEALLDSLKYYLTEEPGAKLKRFSFKGRKRRVRETGQILQEIITTIVDKNNKVFRPEYLGINIDVVPTKEAKRYIESLAKCKRLKDTEIHVGSMHQKEFNAIRAGHAHGS